MVQWHSDLRNPVPNMYAALAVQLHLWNVQLVCTTTIIMEIAIYPKKLIVKYWFVKHPDSISLLVTKIVLSKWIVQLVVVISVIFTLLIVASATTNAVITFRHYENAQKDCTTTSWHKCVTWRVMSLVLWSQSTPKRKTMSTTTTVIFYWYVPLPSYY